MRTVCFTACLLLLSTLLGWAPSTHAQEASEENEVKPAKLFDTTDTLEVTLKGPWRDLTKKKEYQGTYPATIEYVDDLGNSAVHELTVERRGITRQRVCSYPPIKLRFEKEKVKGTTFRGQKSLKMVTHCQKSSSYEQYYVKEMLAYLYYNVVTDMSFRIRPLTVNYVDSESGKEDDDRFAFLIEDDSDVAKRFDLKKIQVPNLKLEQMEPKTAGEFSLYQFMIGNVDWSALRGPDPKECCHNVKLIGPEPLQEGDMAYPVPYDFDSSGLVNAKYAVPPAGIPIKSITQRLYRGYCDHNDEVIEARQRFLELEAAFMAVIEQETRLDSSSRKWAEKYLDQFYKIIKDDKKFNGTIIEKCRK